MVVGRHEWGTQIRESAVADQPTVTMRAKGDGYPDPDRTDRGSTPERGISVASMHKGRNLARSRPLRVPPGGRRRFLIAFGVDTLSCLRR
jgi:hypothetical protein